MITPTYPDGSSGGPTARGSMRRPLLAVCGLALVASLGACSSDPTDEAAANGAGPTYADGSTEPTGSSSGTDAAGETASGEEPATGGVVVTYWHWNGDAGAVEAAGYVDGVIEDGGTCTLTLTRSGTVLSGDAPAISDASSTSCGTVGVPVPAGNAGDWEAVLAYESSAGRSSSETFTVTVP